MSRSRYTHNKTAAISFTDGTPKRKKWGGGNPRRTEIDPSFRGGLRTRKRIGQSHIDWFHKQASTAAVVAGDEDDAYSTHPVAKVSATLAVKSGGGTADDTTTISKTSKVAGPK